MREKKILYFGQQKSKLPLGHKLYILVYYYLLCDASMCLKIFFRLSTRPPLPPPPLLSKVVVVDDDGGDSDFGQKNVKMGKKKRQVVPQPR